MRQNLAAWAAAGLCACGGLGDVPAPIAAAASAPASAAASAVAASAALAAPAAVASAPSYGAAAPIAATPMTKFELEWPDLTSAETEARTDAAPAAADPFD